jgi:hypothetical protein
MRLPATNSIYKIGLAGASFSGKEGSPGYLQILSCSLERTMADSAYFLKRLLILLQLIWYN